MKPFNVRRWASDPAKWIVYNRLSGRAQGPFDTQAEAIDFAYKNWPWWP